jgi:cytochrome c peroxidase
VRAGSLALARAFGVALVLLAPASAQAQAEPAPVAFTDEERAILLELSPVPEPPDDPTNAVFKSAAAARLGRALFFDGRLSADGSVSCSKCHSPALSWTDGKPVGFGLSGLSRHTMTLWNVAQNRWFFWDGRKDSLWSQALGPLEDAREHGTSRLAILHVIAGDPGYVRAWREVFGELPPLDDARRFPPEGRPVPGEPEHPHAVAWATMAPEDQELVSRAFANVGKAIAAFERLLVSRAAPFDRFVEGLRTNDPEKLAALDASAQRGARIFVGEGKCVVCHDGPTFTDLEFHDNRAPIGEGGDPGRRLGLRRLRDDPFNALGAFADDGGETGRIKLDLLVRDNHLGKQFKTPTLRNVARTAPYMHEGQLASLAEVVHFYSRLENASPENPSERIVQPLDLSAGEEADLVAFLESLTDESLPAELFGPPPTPYVRQ